MRSKTAIIVFIFLILLMPYVAYADIAPEIEWEKHFGGNRPEIFCDIIHTSDGGYIAVGLTRSMSSSIDFYVIKFNPDGEVEWENNYGGIKMDIATSICQTSDGGYIIGGETSSFNVGLEDLYIIKLDPDGELKWEKTFGEAYHDTCADIIQTNDGGYIAAGESWKNTREGDVYIIKLDSSGNMEWDKNIGGGLEDGAYDIQQTPDGGYILAGYTAAEGGENYDVYIIKTDPDGNEIWKSEFGGNNDDKAYSIEQYGDGYIVAGYSKSNSAASDIYVIMIDKDGNKISEDFYGSSGSNEEAFSIKKTADGGYIIVGKTDLTDNEGYDAYIMKFDQDGNEQWSRTKGGKNDDVFYSVSQDSDGGYITAGETKSLGNSGDAYVIKVKGSGLTITDQNDNEDAKQKSPANSIMISFLILVTAGFLMKKRLF